MYHSVTIITLNRGNANKSAHKNICSVVNTGNLQLQNKTRDREREGLCVDIRQALSFHSLSVQAEIEFGWYREFSGSVSQFDMFI